LKEEISSLTQITNSRRNFIKGGAAGAAGSAINWDAASYARVLGSNDRISVGVVGHSRPVDGPSN